MLRIWVLREGYIGQIDQINKKDWETRKAVSEMKCIEQLKD